MENKKDVTVVNMRNMFRYSDSIESDNTIAIVYRSLPQARSWGKENGEIWENVSYNLKTIWDTFDGELSQVTGILSMRVLEVDEENGRDGWGQETLSKTELWAKAHLSIASLTESMNSSVVIIPLDDQGGILSNCITHERWWTGTGVSSH